MTESLPAPILVQDGQALDELLGTLSGEEQIAVDTEADSFFSYREKVCLIQITADGRDFLVDPLADLDLTGLGRVFADPKRVKIFHDGEYDVLILKREYGFDFANLFDTRIAASALGSMNPGLANVLEEHFGVVLDKSMQRSDWGERPLTDRQIDYARLDTHYLLALKAQQERKLAELGRTMIVEGECRRLEELDAVQNGFNPDEWVRLKGARTLRPEARQALRELCILRDRLALESDVPPFRVMNNAALFTIAKERPETTQALAEIKGISWRQVRKMGDDVLDALARARELGPLNSLPKLPPRDGTGGFDPLQQELFERLKAWRRDRAEAEGFDASLVLNRHALVRLAREGPTKPDELRRVEGVIDWQVERFGEKLLELLKGFAADAKAGRIQIGRRRRRGE